MNDTDIGHIGWPYTERSRLIDPDTARSIPAQFDKTGLRRYPVAVCTHEGYKKEEASLFRNWKHGGRTFIIIDEMVKEVTQHTVDIEAVARVVKLANQDEDAPLEALTALDAQLSCGTHTAADTHRYTE
jgi:hypothetical protein